MEKKPNILWFVADQMRSDTLSHLGNPASQTDCIDALARDGVSFRNAYCQNPVCVPSRCSFLTGLYPHTLGHRTMHYLMKRDDPSILKVMKENGYEVIWIGRNDYVPTSWKKTDWCDKYFDGSDLEDKAEVEGAKLTFAMPDVKPEIPDVMKSVNLKYSFFMGKLPEHSLDNSFDWNCVNAALKYMDERSRQPDAKPFFIYCTLMFPHPPYGCEEPWYSLIDRNALPERRADVEKLDGKANMLKGIRDRQDMKDWSEVQYNELRAVYLGMTARFDYQLGMLTDKLKELGEYDNTSVFVFSDHGDLTGDYGIAEKCQNCFEDPLTNVPLVIKPAKQFELKSGINDALVELLDLPATICDMAGIDIGYKQFGQSLLHVIAGDTEHKRGVFCEGGRLPGETQAMEPEHPKESMYWPRISLQHEDEGETSHMKACMYRESNLKYIMRLYENDELYDLKKDPMELVNLIDDTEYAADVKRMRDELLQLYMATADFVPTKMDKR